MNVQTKENLKQALILAKYNKFTILLLVFLCAFVGVIGFVLSSTGETDSWVRGTYSKYCYQMDNYPRQIKELKYFNSKKECESGILTK